MQSLPPCDCVETQPGKPAWGRAPEQGSPVFPGKRDQVRHGDFPPKGGRQMFISGLQWLCETECWSPPVPPTNPPRQKPLLFVALSSSLCRDELSIGKAEPAPWGATTGFVPGRGHGRDYASKFFFSLPASSNKVCFL